jgi:hypothetical protein
MAQINNKFKGREEEGVGAVQLIHYINIVLGIISCLRYCDHLVTFALKLQSLVQQEL